MHVANIFLFFQKDFRNLNFLEFYAKLDEIVGDTKMQIKGESDLVIHIEKVL